MAYIYEKVKEKILRTVGKNSDFDEDMNDYVEIDTDVDKGPKAKVLVRPFFIEDFADIKPALDSLREGTTIALINIRPLKDKDIIELKRAVNKLKKTCDAIEGDIAGFGEDWIVVTPSFAQIYRTTQTEDVQATE
jgi:SepF-like predicted cell division protein (DUF552 family)